MRLHPWLVFALASTLAAVLVAAMFAWPDGCRYPIWSERPGGEIVTFHEGGAELRALVSGATATVCGSSQWGPALIVASGFLFFVQGAVVAIFGPRPRFLYVALAAIVSVLLLPLLINWTFIDMSAPEVSTDVSIAEFAVIVPFAVGIAALGAWVERKR